MNQTSAPRGARRWRLALPATVCLLSATSLAGCVIPGGSASAPTPRCAEHHGLPDRRCTPGAIRSSVTVAAICAFGYSRAVRPPESFTEPLKLAQMRAYGLPGSPGDFEEDHLVPLSIGGAPRDPRNLWPEPRTGPDSAEQKDRLETWAARIACADRIPLSRLQRSMASDWIALYRSPGGARVLAAYPPGG